MKRPRAKKSWRVCVVRNFEPLQQDMGTNSCFTTGVRAILQFRGYAISQMKVAEWCGEDELGCSAGEAIFGLQEQDCTVTKLSGIDESIQSVNDPDEPTPVLVSLQPSVTSEIEHVVVVVGSEVAVGDGGREDYVHFMDPTTGLIESAHSEWFWQMWEAASGMALIIDPP